MLKYTAKRLIIGVITLLVLATITFFLMKIIPGSPFGGELAQLSPEVREKLLAILADTCPGVDFENGTNLCDEGLITSFDIVAIVSELGLEFGVEIDVDDLTPENFNSADAILELVKRAGG